MRLVSGVLAPVLLFLSFSASPAISQDASAASANAAGSEVSFAFTRVGMPVPKYTLRIKKDGSGTYKGEEAMGAASSSFERRFQLSPATTARIFKLSADLNHFNTPCASKLKNIADTGTKTVTYTSADANGSCTYNYTEVKNLQALTETFQGVAEMMDRGRELDHLHRFDRLGLDAAMSSLADEVAGGRAVAVETIAKSLQSLAQDEELMERVRKKASALLAQVPADLR